MSGASFTEARMFVEKVLFMLPTWLYMLCGFSTLRPHWMLLERFLSTCSLRQTLTISDDCLVYSYRFFWATADFSARSLL